VTGKSYISDELNIGTTTDLGNYKLQVDGAALLGTGTRIGSLVGDGILDIYSPTGYYYPET
jgi:hypothetical protein